jgi:hypothetical protein
VTLAWDAPKAGSIAYYTVLEKSTWASFTVKAPQTSFTRTRLWPNINHSWVVYAVATRGHGSVTYTVNVNGSPRADGLRVQGGGAGPGAVDLVRDQRDGATTDATRPRATRSR